MHANLCIFCCQICQVFALQINYRRRDGAVGVASCSNFRHLPRPHSHANHVRLHFVKMRFAPTKPGSGPGLLQQQMHLCIVRQGAGYRGMWWGASANNDRQHKQTRTSDADWRLWSQGRPQQQQRQQRECQDAGHAHTQAQPYLGAMARHLFPHFARNGRMVLRNTSTRQPTSCL